MLIRIAAGIVALLISLASVGQTAAISAPDLINETKLASRALEAADFTEIDYPALDGSRIRMGVDGKEFYVDSDNVSSFTVQLFNPKYRIAKNGKTFRERSFSVDLSSEMDRNTIYGVMVSYLMDDIVFSLHSNFIFRDKSGNLHFYKTSCYEFNLDRTGELRTDPASLDDYLKPQNDVESDNPCIVSYSNQICENCTDDRQKVFAIYSYVTNRMAYDSVQVTDKHVYQDDALLVMRRSIAVCEGFANAFTALCRAQGIPATVEYGLGLSSYDSMTGSEKEDNEIADHAWAAVCLDGEWLFVDPTYDIVHYYEGYGIESTDKKNNPYYSFFLMPLEAFSFEHKILDSDTVHGYERSGSCGSDARYSVSRDGTLTISGSGEIKLPYGVNDFSRVVFAPDSNITTIGKECFLDCDLLTQVILPDSVTRIEAGAFSTCEDLEYVYIPDGVTYIGRNAFFTCDELAYVRVPDSVKEIGKNAFDRCPRLILSVPAGFKKVTRNYSVKPYYVEAR